MRLSKNNGKKLNNKGFTLVEVLLSITILTLITIPLMKYFQDSLRYSKLTEERQRATLAAQQEIETMKSVDQLIVKVPDSMDASKLVYGIPALTTNDTYTIVSKPDDFETNGKGKVKLKKKLTSSDMDYEVFVTLDTNVPANAVQRASVYGINDDENVMVVEQTEEMDALWYFLQLNNSYVVTQHGFADVLHTGEGEVESTSESGEGEGGAAGDEPEHHDTEVTMLNNINEVRKLLQREIYITIGREALAPNYYTVKVEYVYSCNKKIAAGDVGEDKFSSGELVNDRIATLKGVYLMYNIVDPDTDKVHIIWDALDPTDASQVPEILLVCQNLDSLIGETTPIPDVDPETLAAGELAPVYFQKDKAIITVDCIKALDGTQALNGFEPKIRTNFKATSTEENDKAQIMLGDASTYPNVESLTAWDTPVRIINVQVDVFKYKSDNEADYVEGDEVITVKTSKGE